MIEQPPSASKEALDTTRCSSAAQASPDNPAVAWLRRFVRESNAIEGILREPTGLELGSTAGFIGLTKLTVDHVVDLVSVYQPDAVLRDRPGLNVRVGNHIAPPGGPKIRADLETLLATINRDPRDPYKAHLIYETLHPFTDGNGRSGRAIWAWQVKRLGGTRLSLRFLHWWYYATLAAIRLPPTGRVELGERSNTAAAQEDNPDDPKAPKVSAGYRELVREMSANPDILKRPMVQQMTPIEDAPPAVVDYTERARDFLHEISAGPFRSDERKLVKLLSAVASERPRRHHGEADMTEHDLKVAPEFWPALASGEKNFECRYAGDRDFKVGDILHLREWSGTIPTPEGKKWTTEVGYTGREVYRRITYILTGEEWGLRRDYAVLALVETEKLT